MTQPCFDPAPHWIQIPAIMLTLVVLGCCLGFVAGGLWFEWCDTKLHDWLMKKLGGKG